MDENTLTIDESTLEKKVGDIATRKRIISDLLYDNNCKEIAYGPLTLKLSQDNSKILINDFDGRVYTPITIPDKETEKQITHISFETDKRIEKLHEEL